MKVTYYIDAYVWNSVRGQYDPSVVSEYHDLETARRAFNKKKVSVDMPQISLERYEEWGDDSEVERLAIKYLYKNKQIVEEYDV